MKSEAEVHAVQLAALLAVKKALATEVSVLCSWGSLTLVQAATRGGKGIYLPAARLCEEKIGSLLYCRSHVWPSRASAGVWHAQCSCIEPTWVGWHTTYHIP